MKYRALIILAFLVFSNPYNYPQNKIAIGLNVVPAITYSFSTEDLPSPKSYFGYSFGVNGVYIFQPDFFLETGLTYQHKRLLYAKDVPYTKRAWIDVNGNGIVDNGDRLDFSLIVPSDLFYDYSSLSLPITINYKTSKNYNTSLICSFGINLNYIFNLEEISRSNKFGQNSEGNIPSSDFTASASWGLALFQPIGYNIFLIFGPKYDYDLFPTKRNTEVQFHTLGFSIKLFLIL